MAKWCGWIVMALTSSLVLSPARARDLDARQRQLLADATRHQSQFESNLKLALDAAGPGDSTPSGSKARLAATRLQSAMQSVPTLEARFAELPADDSQVKALRDRFDATLTDARMLEARLSGQRASGSPVGESGHAAPGAATPVTAGGRAKLDYRQEEALKGARFNLEQVDGYANALGELVAEITGAADKSAIDYRVVARGMNTISEARRKLGFAADAVASLPAHGEGVAAVVEQQKLLAARIDAAEQALQPIHEQLQKSVNVGNHADLAADRARLGELAMMFNTGLLGSDNRAVAEVIRGADAARRERDRIAVKYADLLKQDTDASRELAGAIRHFDVNHTNFTQVVTNWVRNLPQAIDAGIRQVNEMAATAVAEDRPLWFSRGIADKLNSLENDLTLLSAVDPGAANAFAGKLTSLRAEVKQQEAKLAEKIIAGNALPPDRYRGGDRAELEALALQQWKMIQPDAQVLRIVIPGEQWERETKWRLENATWYKIDRSRLQAQLLVVKDDRLAVIRPVNLWIDHVNNDKRTATVLDDIKDEVGPQLLILREKIR